MDKGFANMKLEDDCTTTGGIAYVGETLGEFCGETNLEDITLAELNEQLRICGIKPLFEKEKTDLACLIAYYIGTMDKDGLADRIHVMCSISDKIADYEFVADSNGDISTDVAYDDAYRIATEIMNDLIEWESWK